MLFIVFGIARVFHKLSSLMHQEIIGAFLFILLFSISIIYYYLGLFRKKEVQKGEYFLSVLFTFFLTVFMFAFIYSEPIEDSQNYFVEFGRPYNITFSDAFYFSTTTITTLGMGDIAPVGVFRSIVVIEVLIGLIYAGSMVYFITREFEER